MCDIWGWVRRTRLLERSSSHHGRSVSAAGRGQYGFSSLGDMLPQVGGDRPPLDPLTQAAWDLVGAYDDYIAAIGSGFDQRSRLARSNWMARFRTRYADARRSYCQKSTESFEPFHREIASLFGDVYRERNFIYPAGDGPVIRFLKNELRAEPRMKTLPAEGWVNEISPRMGSATTRPTRTYTSILALEVKQTMPDPAILCLDVGVGVSEAKVALTLKTAFWRTTDVMWKESRVWLLVDEPRLGEGDRIEITVFSSELIAPTVPVRIGNVVQQVGQVRASA
jgi:hypothetical protein